MRRKFWRGTILKREEL